VTHSDVFFALKEKFVGINELESDALMEIVSSVGDKGDSLRRFYIEVITSSKYLDLPTVKTISDKYSVPKLYASHISSKFDNFVTSIRLVCKENASRKMSGKPIGENPDGWTKNGVPMFGSTEKLTINKAGGLAKICGAMNTPGYTDHLEDLFKESATDVAKIKYAKLIKGKTPQLEYKE